MNKENRNERIALTDDELEQVTGGDRHEETTDMHCFNPNCPNPDALTWVGDYMNENYYECIFCNQMTLKGVRLNKP